MLSSPEVYHQRMVSRLHIEMDRYLSGKPCDVFVSPFDVKLLRRGNTNFKNIVQPDLLIICNWKDNIEKNGKYAGIPKLVVEVLSRGNTSKEMFTKLDLYRDSGIEEYWIIDPFRGDAMIYGFKNYKINETRIYKAGDRCESIIYPGLGFCVEE